MKDVGELLKRYSKHTHIQPAIKFVDGAVYDDKLLLGTVHS